MGGIGSCPCCKKIKDLTKHHDKQLNKKVMICRDCHDVLEKYIKLQEKISS